MAAALKRLLLQAWHCKPRQNSNVLLPVLTQLPLLPLLGVPLLLGVLLLTLLPLLSPPKDSQEAASEFDWRQSQAKDPDVPKLLPLP
jgi:hypothetical protein